MKQILLAATFAALAISLQPAPAAASGPIETACLRADRPGSGALCRCIQAVADRTLSRSDQRQAARFFADPQRAQDVRMSSRAADNEFWARYRNFGATAEALCRV